MKILVIGQGGREHALVRALSFSPSVEEVHVIPGSPGMSQHAICHSKDWRDFESLTKFCLETKIDFVFIGPEDPLVLGLADHLRGRGILVVGPGKEGAMLEGSKIFAKHFMVEAQIPTAAFHVVDSWEKTKAGAMQFKPPYVLKADGLAAGKGVVICKTLQELESASRDFFEKKILGESGTKALLENFTSGWELSYIVITNGQSFHTLPMAQDHKRLGDNDQGPNTGGMGTIAPIKIPSELRTAIDKKIVEPTLRLIQEKGMVFRGIIFFGLMITDQGPSLLEFNCRLGDPETQVILPLIDGDLGEIFLKLAQGKMPEIKFRHLASCCVVLAAPGYPQKAEQNVPIEGDPKAETSSSYFIHAGTGKNSNDQWVTKGGRVLCAVGLGSNLSEARVQAYSLAKKVHWQGLQMRTDIGAKQSD